MPTETPLPVTGVIVAANLGDTDAFIAGFTPDGAVDDWGREFHGPDAIRGWSDAEFIGVDVSLDVIDVSAVGDDVVVRAEVGGGGFNGTSTFTFAIADDKVSRMTIRE